MWRFRYRMQAVTWRGSPYDAEHISDRAYSSADECYRTVNNWNRQHRAPHWYHYTLIQAWRE